MSDEGQRKRGGSYLPLAPYPLPLTPYPLPLTPYPYQYQFNCIIAGWLNTSSGGSIDSSNVVSSSRCIVHVTTGIPFVSSSSFSIESTWNPSRSSISRQR